MHLAMKKLYKIGFRIPIRWDQILLEDDKN